MSDILLERPKFRSGPLAAAAGLGLACLLLGLVLTRMPFLVLGAVVGGVVLLIAIQRPLLVIGVMLALGPVDLSFLTGGFKGLFASLGGLDMNGIRLVGLTAALFTVLVVNRRVASAATDSYGRWYALFLLFAAGTLAVSPAPLDGLRLLFKLAYPFLLFVVVRGVARKEEDVERLADVILIGAAVITLVANPLFVLSGGYNIDDSGHLRVMGLGAHQNPFSFYLLLMSLLAITRFATRGQLRYLLLTLVFAGWIVATMTRITMLAAGVAFSGVGIYSALANRNYRGMAAAVTAAALVVVPLMPFVLERSLGYVPGPGEMLGLLSDPVFLYHAINWQGREVFWPIVFGVFLQNPITGSGLGTSTAVVLANAPGHIGGVIHNEYLRLAADTGLVGCMLFGSAVLAWLAGAARAGGSGDLRLREVALPAIGGILAWGVVAMTDNPFDYYSPFTQYIAFFAAGALVLGRIRREAEEGDSPSVVERPGIV